MSLRDRLPFLRRRAEPTASGPPGGLPCRELVELVTDYLEDALTPADRARFEQHIAACEHCSAYLEQMRVTLRVVGHLDPDDLQPHVERDLLDAFRDWKAGDSA